MIFVLVLVLVLVLVNTLVAKLHMTAEIDAAVNILEATGAIWTSAHPLAILKRREEEWAKCYLCTLMHRKLPQLPNLLTSANAIGGWL